MNPYLQWTLIGGAGVVMIAFLAWFFFLRAGPALEPSETTPQQTLPTAQSLQNGATSQPVGQTNAAEAIPSPISTQKVFKISDGPVAGATFMQELRPTTTIARFVMQKNGHVLDLGLDIPGSVARAASNTTIPGVARVTWEVQNEAMRQVAAGAILQYLDDTTIKSVLLNFPTATTTGSSTVPAPVRIQFLPNNILSLAASPDGRSIVYLLAAAGGAEGYLARQDGSNVRRLFSLPLAQVSVSWPAAGTILVTSKAAAGVAGIAFSIDATSGAVSPILYAPGLTATADSGFTQVVYQSATQAARISYAHNTRTNLDRPLSFDPMPDKCVWSRTRASVLYCAAPLSYLPPNYLDLWYAGTASAADSLLSYNLITGETTILATPGSAEGGVPSDVAQLAVSPDEKYLLFVKKGDRSLWGVRLY